MALTQKQVDRLNKSMVSMQTPTPIGNMLGSMEAGLEGVAELATSIVETPAPIPASITLTGSKKIVTIPYNKAIFTTLSDVDLKAAITWAAGGVTFVALGASDTVARTDFNLVITFDSALTLATNKIKIDGNTIYNAAKLADVTAYITPAISAA